jgi:hypothetical protein
VGGVHALERRLENESYWFARMGQISLNLNSDGVTFQDSELAKLSEPLEGAWHTGRERTARKCRSAPSGYSPSGGNRRKQQMRAGL